MGGHRAAEAEKMNTQTSTPAQSAGVFFSLEDLIRVVRRDQTFNVLPVFTAEELCRKFDWNLDQAMEIVKAIGRA